MAKEDKELNTYYPLFNDGLYTEVVHESGERAIKILKGIFPDKTGYKIKNRKFRFCHIDVDTYYSTKDCLNWIWKRLVKGGVIIFDDYGYSITEGVTKIVNEHRNMKDRFFIYNLTGQAIMIKK